MSRFSFTPLLNTLLQLLLLNALFLGVMTLFRFVLFELYRPAAFAEAVRSDIMEAFVLGVRLDLSVLGYLALIPVLLLIASRFLMGWQAQIYKAIYIYYGVVLALVSGLLAGDIAFYSYFKEHFTLMVFGLFDDDTAALWRTAVENYNLPLAGVAGAGYLLLFLFVLLRLRRYAPLREERFWPPIWQGAFFVVLLTGSLLAARGSFGMYPIAKMVADVSADPFVNSLPQNGVHAMMKAQKEYRASKSGNYDLIKMAGYKGRIREAFETYHGRALGADEALLQTLQRRTAKNAALEQNPPHVVVVMVESFGLPIVYHQSETFDIMGRLKRHFAEDYLFENFISASNGTIVSLEPLLLNITARPKSTAFAQSTYMGVAFEQAAARVYRRMGYETSFVYGGDLSWRNVGSFFARQGFDHVEGKANILSSLGLGEEDAHDWGVYDQHSYDYVIEKLRGATKPQFIFLLTTNNHPPYRIPPSYASHPLEWPEALKQQLTGDMALAQRRIKDYAYALDMAGRFLDELKGSELGEKSVVALTADNNTIEGIMRYDKPLDEGKKIPYYLYLPAALRPAVFDATVPGSHKDLFPTLYSLTLSDAEYTAIGTDLFDEAARHCGFNDAGVIVSRGGAFKKGKPHNMQQEACDAYYRAALAVTEYLIRSQQKGSKIGQLP